MTGVAWDGLGIDERVQDNVHKRAHSPEGVQRPKMDVCARIRRAKASLWGSMRESQSQGRINIKSKATFTKHRSYIGNGEG